MDKSKRNWKGMVLWGIFILLIIMGWLLFFNTDDGWPVQFAMIFGAVLASAVIVFGIREGYKQRHQH